MSTKGWQQVRNYPDHLSHRVVLEQFVEPNYTPEPSHLVPIQVYSLTPLDADHQQLREYLMHSFMHEELNPLFKIYSYCPPDAFACIEHHRREIAHRKQQHRSEASNLPPLIPRFFRPSDDTPVAFCILLRSHSYRIGYTEDWDELADAGEGLTYFTSTAAFPILAAMLMKRTFHLILRASYPQKPLNCRPSTLCTRLISARSS